MKRENVIVIGYGSIGKRHTEILLEMGYKVAVVSRRPIKFKHSYTDIVQAIELEKPIYIVVANETSLHEGTIRLIQSTRYNKQILIEKPLFLNGNVKNINQNNIFVGYNLRFHPIIQRLITELKSERIISVNTYVGQYLPTWRPGSNYETSYSADLEKGGGVLRDLSHELDYLSLLFGKYMKMTALGGKFTSLNIKSDDHFTIIYETNKVPSITVHMNYLDFIHQRILIINTENKTYRADLIENILHINNSKYEFTLEKNETYVNQHKAVLNKNNKFLCTFENALNINKMIDHAELCSKEKVWFSNE